MTQPLHNDDAFWDRQPTALEAAFYNAQLQRQEHEASERARKIFGECLFQLTQLGMREDRARSMLGKWRRQAGDDARLIEIIRTAYNNGTPDPVSYVTKALAGARQRSEKIEGLQKSQWTLLGWEKPTPSPTGLRFKGQTRGQVWRDPFGKTTILPAPDNITPPNLDEDPGIPLDKAA